MRKTWKSRQMIRHDAPTRSSPNGTREPSAKEAYWYPALRSATSLLIRVCAAQHKSKPNARVRAVINDHFPGSSRASGNPCQTSFEWNWRGTAALSFSMLDQPIQTAREHRGNLSKYLKRYQYQRDLTTRLDTLPDEPFSQETINAIVLWKVNRYVRLPQELRDSLHALRVLSPHDHRRAEPVLLNLLDCHGVDLAMASTFLRFQNTDVFQILDRHAYRALFGERYTVNSKAPPNTKVAVYFKYLDSLHELAAARRVAFRELDRILYVFDKAHNGAL
jgi:thermostable 8-oxoguanine DNA glycosylase